MAHPDTEAASSPAPVSAEEKAAAFEEYLFEGEETEGPEEGEEAETDDELLDDEGDEPELSEDEVDEESDEQAEPAIEAPVSLNAEEKEVFAQLPVEAQQAWAASETRRNKDVQEATTSAKEAQRVAQQQAANAEREAEARFGEQLRAYTANFEPEIPDPARYSDIQTYQRDKAIYDHQKAQYDQLMQQVTGIGVETPEQKAQWVQARDAEMLKIPEIANEETRDEFIRTALSVAEELGYDKGELSQSIEAGDMLALSKAAQWKADSEELARIKAGAKSRRRDKSTGRFKTLKPGAAPQPQGRAAKADKAWARVQKNAGKKERQAEAFADYLEGSGIL